jgi:hypothetical protein
VGSERLSQVEDRTALAEPSPESLPDEGSPAISDLLPGVVGEGPDESFENARPVAVRRPSERENGGQGESAASKPKLEEMLARIPTEARQALEKLFRTKPTVVRRIRPDQMI